METNFLQQKIFQWKLEAETVGKDKNVNAFVLLMRRVAEEAKESKKVDDEERELGK